MVIWFSIKSSTRYMKFSSSWDFHSSLLSQMVLMNPLLISIKNKHRHFQEYSSVLFAAND